MQFHRQKLNEDTLIRKVYDQHYPGIELADDQGYLSIDLVEKNRNEKRHNMC